MLLQRVAQPGIGFGARFPPPIYGRQRPQQLRLVVEAKPTKASEFRSLSVEDIEQAIYDCQKALLDQRIARKSRKSYKPDQFGWNRNKIAQLHTILREREIEKGVGKRESRKIAKRKRLDAGFGQY